MTEEIKEILEYFKSDDIHLIQCEHKWCDAYGYEKSQMKKDLLDYITNLQQENKSKTHQIEVLEEIVNYERNIRNDKLQQENEKLKYNTRGQVNDYFKDKYADEVLKNAELKKENEELNRMCELLYSKSLYNAELTYYKQRNEKVIEYINFIINHYKEQLETPIEDTYFNSDVNRKGYILSIIAYLQTILDTLIGSDEK